MYLKIYYEPSYTEEAYSMIDSYKHFFKNNKNVSDLEKYKNNKFVDYYRRLLSVKISGKSFNLIKFKKIISGEENLIYKDWLLEKINELK